jgi:hypothetical protein
MPPIGCTLLPAFHLVPGLICHPKSINHPTIISVRQLQSKSPRLIRSLIPLHQPAMLKRLQRRWVFVSPLRLLSPPIGQIGAYFGLEIGLYFAWLAHFTGWLCAPALIGQSVDVDPSVYPKSPSPT